MKRNIRGAALVEYAFLLVFSLMIVGATAKLLGAKSGRGPASAVSTLR